MFFNKILITTDFSDQSHVAFDLAAYEAKMSGSEIHLITIVDDWNAPEEILKELPDPESISRYRNELRSSAEEKLKALKQEYFHDQHVTINAILSSKIAAHEICEYAEREKCNAIVIASHGKGAVGHFFLGSVVQKVIRWAKCPVIVVPKKEN